MQNFSQQLNNIKSLKDIITELKKKGHPKYTNYHREFDNGGGFDQTLKDIEEEIDKCKMDLSIWNEWLEEIMGKYPLLTLIPYRMQEFFRLILLKRPLNKY